MSGFVLLRVRAHRLLLTAALLAVLLTTSVLAMLSAFSGAIGDAALRNSLRTRDAATTALTVKADVPAEGRGAADAAVRSGARDTFDGLPVRVEKLMRSGPYALPRSLQPPAARSGNPDLTQFAALERGEVRITKGRAPKAAQGSKASQGSKAPVEAALPEAVARQLKLRPGDKLTLKDRIGGPTVSVVLTGVYRPVRPTAPYWKLDDLGGRGIQKISFTTYGPLLAAPADLAAGRVSAGKSAWLASADFSSVTTSDIDRLRTSAREGTRALLREKALAGTTGVTTSLPETLDRAERALLVSRSTLLIVALQLVLLATYTLLLVARLLSTDRAGETWMLRARGGSRARVTSLAAIEALLLALPAAVCAPLLAGPLIRLLSSWGALSRIGLRLDVSADRGVWLVAVAVAVGCALAVTVPSLSAAGPERGRARALPAPLRAGADVGLLVIAAVAYWQLDRQTSGSGTLSSSTSGTLGIDPLLVTAPALALLAGTVLTLRLLPPAAKLAERRAAGGRGLPSALAGWQLSRRPLRGAGPVLLLVLAVAMGMLAIGQGASWNRSQEDQADFRAGASIRVLAEVGGLGRAGVYAAAPGVRDAAPAVRATMPLTGSREATVLALDTAHATDHLMLRDDMASKSPSRLLSSLRTGGDGRSPGVVLPADTAGASLTLRLSAPARPHDASPSDVRGTVTAIVEDRYGIPYQVFLDDLPADGRPHRLTMDLGGGGSFGGSSSLDRPATPLTLTGLALDIDQPVTETVEHRLTFEGLRSVNAAGAQQSLKLGTRWQASVQGGSEDNGASRPSAPVVEQQSGGHVSVGFDTGQLNPLTIPNGAPPRMTVRLHAKRPPAKEVTAVATDRFLSSSGTTVGSTVAVPVNGAPVKVRISASVRALPTTGPEAGADTTTGTAAGPKSADGGALLLDLPTLNRALADRHKEAVLPDEWWLSTEPGRSAEAAAALRARPYADPAQVVVRSEIAESLRDDPLGAGPQSALAAAAVAAALLAAVGFAVNTAGSMRERGDEFAILRALGAPRRQLARLVAAEQGILVALALLVGLALGSFLTRAVVPLVVLTGQATQPMPRVLVELPWGQVLLLLAGVAVTPVLITAGIALRRPPDAAITLRRQGSE
ncbi:FtsX-like permease family protein [Streptomyces sp. NPDC051453]|uniref:FtsX-like permease family protein n=1 Tax=Streptomyces sp. NPDC051453 TaxID=3154941 RepID=UPI00342195F8